MYLVNKRHIKRQKVSTTLTEKQESEADTETGLLHKRQQEPEVGLVHTLAVRVKVGLQSEGGIPEVGPKGKHGHRKHVLSKHLKKVSRLNPFVQN